MRRKIMIAVTIIVCFLLQCTVFRAFEIASVAPNLLIVVTASFGFMRGRREGLFVGFFCGLILDLMFGSTLGFHALIYMYIGFLNGYFKQIFYPDEIRLPIILIAVSDFCCNLTIYLVLFLFRGRFEFGYYLLHTMIPELVYTMVVTIVLYFILLKMNQRLEEIEKRSETKFG